MSEQASEWQWAGRMQDGGRTRAGAARPPAAAEPRHDWAPSGRRIRTDRTRPCRPRAPCVRGTARVAPSPLFICFPLMHSCRRRSLCSASACRFPCCCCCCCCCSAHSVVPTRELRLATRTATRTTCTLHAGCRLTATTGFPAHIHQRTPYTPSATLSRLPAATDSDNSLKPSGLVGRAGRVAANESAAAAAAALLRRLEWAACVEKGDD